MGFKCGIVGLPNVGKSTIFNALTSAKAASENFPFCTIEPNTGVVPVPDPRLNKLAELAKSEKEIPTQVTFVDIAGLIKGASQGEGLGNQFLGHIRSVDAIAHVVRCFDDENVVHVDGSIEPVRDIETIDTELILADLDSVQKQLQRLTKAARANDKLIKAACDEVKLLETHLGEGKPARTFERSKNEFVLEVASQLLTEKPIMFVANVSEDDAGHEPSTGGDHPVDKVFDYATSQGSNVIVISGQVEAEISELDREDRAEYLEELGLEQSGLDLSLIHI